MHSMIIPSIDLMDGKAVQLKQGKDKMLERDNPLDLAKEFNKIGQIAVIDLDAAMNKGNNRAIIREICKIAECRVGGGIRDIETAREIISFGAFKIIIGTKAFENDQINHQFLKELSEAVTKQRVMIAIDAFEGEIVTKGWKHKTGLNLFDVAEELEPYSSEFLFTCVEKEGGMQGTDMETIKQLKKTNKNKLTVAGGVTTMEEVVELAALELDAQLGMALYTGQIDLVEAFIESLNWGKQSLIPTIATDPAGQVLMIAYSNKDSIRTAFKTGNMCYFSRSRNKLWIKGETSGHLQKLIQMRTDCDFDALLVTVKQTGAACHHESYSCFGDRKFSLNELYDVVKDRLDNPVAGSYTASFSDQKLRDKILEEANEVVSAKTKDEIIWEIADILYSLTVLLAKNNVQLSDVFTELRRRRRK